MARNAHINDDGLWQSDKYPTCPPGKVPLSVKDPMAQDLLAEYARRRRAVDSEFSDGLEIALGEAGYVGPTASELTGNRILDVVRQYLNANTTWPEQRCKAFAECISVKLAAALSDGLSKDEVEAMSVAYAATIAAGRMLLNEGKVTEAVGVMQNASTMRAILSQRAGLTEEQLKVIDAAAHGLEYSPRG